MPTPMPNEAVERVAFDLMTKIAQEEPKQERKEDNPREYYIRLYIQCLKAVSGEDIVDIFDEDQAERGDK